MSQCCGFNIFMAENIRHALMCNMHDNKYCRFKHTYKEYPLYPRYSEGCKFIDVVGKQNHKDSIKHSVVVEVKSDWTDFNTGHGLNLYGAWNFIAVQEGDFAKELLYKMCLERDMWKSVGLLQVTLNGSVETLLPANGIWCKFWAGQMYIENHWEDLKDKADKNGYIDKAFQKKFIPIYKEDNEYRKSKRLPVERLIISPDEYRYLLNNTTDAFRESILGIDDIPCAA